MSSDAPAELTAEEQESLLRQLEFYFCDLSFPFDEFLKGQAAADGSIPASVLAASPRIVSLTPALDAAGREALLLSLVERSDSVVLVGAAHFGRKFPLPAEDPAAPRSVYIAGLPKDADEAKVTAMLTETKQATSFVPILSVRRLRDLQKSRAFTGHVFVECEDATKAAALAKAAAHGAVDCKKAKLLKEYFSSQATSIVDQRAKRAAGGAPPKAGGPAAPAQAASGAKRAREEAPEVPVERGTVRNTKYSHSKWYMAPEVPLERGTGRRSKCIQRIRMHSVHSVYCVYCVHSVHSVHRVYCVCSVCSAHSVTAYTVCIAYKAYTAYAAYAAYRTCTPHVHTICTPHRTCTPRTAQVVAFEGVGAEASREAVKELCVKHGGEGSVAFVEHYPGVQPYVCREAATVCMQRGV